MPSPSSAKKGRPHLRRDEQQWLFDWMVKENGKTFHFQPDGRGRMPRTVRSHDMIAKHVGLRREEIRASGRSRGRGRAPRNGDGALLPGDAAIRTTRSTSSSRPATRSASCTAGSCAATTRCGSSRRTASSTWTCRGTARWCPATCTSRRATGAKPLVFYVPGLRPDQGSVAASVLQPGAPARHACVLVRRAGAGREQSARHSPHRGQLRRCRERGHRLSAATPGSRCEEDRRLRALLRLVLGHAHRGERTAHRGGGCAVGLVRRQVLPDDRRIAALQAALRLSHAVGDRGRARQGCRRHDMEGPHGEDHSARRCSWPASTIRARRSRR